VDEDYDPNGEGGEGGEGGTGNTNTSGFPSNGITNGGNGIGVTNSSDGSGGTGAPLEGSPTSDGCGCRVAGEPAQRSPWWLALPLGLGVALARRRRPNLGR